MEHIVVIAEHLSGRIRPVTWELIAFARELKRLRNAPLSVLIPGEDISAPAEEISARTGCRVLAINTPGLQSYNSEAYKEILAAQLRETGATHVCIANSTQGLDFSPGLAIRLKGACITGVEKVTEKDGRLCFLRKIYNGKMTHTIVSDVGVTLLTVEPGVFKASEDEIADCHPVEYKNVSWHSDRVRNLGVEKSEAGIDSALNEADIIVAAGRGIGKEENLELIRKFASLFPRAAVAGSRPICDLGWLEYGRQVGITGATVTPKVYIACGISGATQHLTGMRGSGFIVAINTDPNTALFNDADLCIVEDLTTFIPAVIGEYKKEKQDE